MYGPTKSDMVWFLLAVMFVGWCLGDIIAWLISHVRIDVGVVQP